MESAELKIDKRLTALNHWLYTECGLQAFSVQPMAGDASFRRYFRIRTDTQSFVAMDANAPTENCKAYIAIANALRQLDLHTPEIVAAEVEQKFLLITDLGQFTCLQILNETNADTWYQRALSALAVLQTCKEVKGHVVPPFTAEFMWQEWAWHREWFLEKLLGLESSTEVEACYAILVDSACVQPQVFMHRDYHSANLMAMGEPHFKTESLGILDFQDAFIGPVTYDLASLLRDCYIAWPNEQVEKWALNYWQQLKILNTVTVTQAEFLRWFDLMSVQRHLKALMTFARKKVRDQQPAYLAHVPRTLNYLIEVSARYPEIKALHDYLLHIVMPRFLREVKHSCAE